MSARCLRRGVSEWEVAWSAAKSKHFVCLKPLIRIGSGKVTFFPLPPAPLPLCSPRYISVWVYGETAQTVPDSPFDWQIDSWVRTLETRGANLNVYLCQSICLIMNRYKETKGNPMEKKEYLFFFLDRWVTKMFKFTMKLKVELRGRALFLFPVKLCGIEAVDQYQKRCFSYKYCINKKPA